MAFTPVARSVKGRLLGVNTTGLAVHTGVNSTMYGYMFRTTADVVQDSTAMMFAQGGITRRTHAADADSTLAAYGFVSITSATADTVTLELSPPIAGVQFTIHMDCSASTLVLNASSSSIHFASTLDVAAADRTTALFATTVVGAGTNLAGSVIQLRGISNTQWQIENFTGAAFPSSGERTLHLTVG